MCGNGNCETGGYSIDFAAGRQDYTERKEPVAYEPHSHTQPFYGSSIIC
jgi:hypothetical protein